MSAFIFLDLGNEYEGYWHAIWRRQQECMVGVISLCRRSFRYRQSARWLFNDFFVRLYPMP
jgi:hypothetical protein